MNVLLIKSKLVAFLIAGILLMSGCKKEYLDSQPDNLLTLEQIFSNRAQTERWWAGLFSEVPYVWSSRFSLVTDELDDSNWQSRGDNIGMPGGINRTFLYEKIRLASIFLENIDRNEEIKQLGNGEQLIQWYKGEARFIRAYYYWYLMKYLGPVVIVPLQSGSPGDNYQIPRSTWDESVDFVLRELAQAKEDLPMQYTLNDGISPDNTYMGRINKVIVTAVESQVLLFHASPLYNGNAEMNDFRNLDGKQLLNSTYNPQRWQDAADKALEAIDMAHDIGKRLYQVGSPTTNFNDAVLSTQNLFWSGFGVEGIWLRPASNDSSWEVAVAPRSVQGVGYNGYAVVQSLIDAYRMNNGEKISESAIYNEHTYAAAGNDYYVSGTNTMYTNREARFYAHINFNGAKTPGIPRSGAQYAQVEFFYTGNSGKGGTPRDWPKTGYTPRKNLYTGYSRVPALGTVRPSMLIRLAELYLNYAEALNEVDHTHPDVLEYLNRVRRRAGLPDIAPGLSQEQLREEIRLERRIELSFEVHRFSDVRRWKVADKPGYYQGGAYYGMNMDKGTSLSDPEFHKRTVAFTRASFHRKFYFLPYGQDEMDRNHQLVEFPGY